MFLFKRKPKTESTTKEELQRITKEAQKSQAKSFAEACKKDSPAVTQIIEQKMFEAAERGEGSVLIKTTDLDGLNYSVKDIIKGFEYEGYTIIPCLWGYYVLKIQWI